MALVLGLTHTQIGNGGSSPLKVTRILEGYLDLTGLWKDPIAATLLLRARGQLNCAYRAKGLEPPDSLPAHGSADAADPPSAQELDDPAAVGLAAARARWPGSFDRWASDMPSDVAAPVLATLVRTRERLTQQPGSPSELVRGLAVACEYLLHACETSGAPKG